MRNLSTRNLETAMSNIARRIRTDLVMSVASVKTSHGGHFHIWLTEAGANDIIWSMSFFDGCLNKVALPLELVTEKD